MKTAEDLAKEYLPLIRKTRAFRKRCELLDEYFHKLLRIKSSAIRMA